MNNKQKILIVGGVAGGATAAARLRRLNEEAEIILLERGEFISFANCGLPYYIGGQITQRSALTLQTPKSFQARFRVEVRTCNEVTAINPTEKTLQIVNQKTGKAYTEAYDQLVLAMGAEPIKPPIPGLDSPQVFSLRTLADTYQIKDYISQHKPATAIVVGGGYIGLEMAENLHAAGLQVTLIEKASQVLAPLDYDMACQVHSYLKSQGIHLLLGEAVERITPLQSGLRVDLADKQPLADLLIMAIGVTPETGIAQKAGLATTPTGHIVTNSSMLTSDPYIYAVGDGVAVTDFVTGQQVAIPLAGPANKQGRIAADNLCGLSSTYAGTQGSSILKVFQMTVATTGINERTAQRLGLSYDKSFTYSPNHATYYPGASQMSIKIIFEKTGGKILGAQIVGFAGVDKRCDVLATAISFGGSAHDLTQLQLCYAPPYSSAKDPVNMAGYVIENLLTGKVKAIHWHDVQALPRDGSVALLDVRNTPEYEQGHLEGFSSLPLDELRDRLQELDPAKPVYVTCQTGLRGYIAARILAQKGFQAYNLNGGYRLYHSIFGNKN